MHLLGIFVTSVAYHGDADHRGARVSDVSAAAGHTAHLQYLPGRGRRRAHRIPETGAL